MNISKIFIDTMATMKPVLLKIFPKEVLQKAKKKWLYKNIKQLAEVDVAPYSREMFPEGINLIGNIKGSSGLGQSARLLALELESTKYPVDIVQHSISDKLNISDTTYDEKLAKQGQLICNSVRIYGTTTII